MKSLRLKWSVVFLYTKSNVDVHAPLSAGVYRLSCQMRDKRPVFYVGQAENLKERLQGHLSYGEPNVCIQRNLSDHTCYFRFASIEGQADRDSAERALYDQHNPECNIVTPPGEPCVINFQ